MLLDLGPVVGSNVSFFGEQLGCKIFVEDIFADIDRHVRDGKLDELPAFLRDALPAGDGTVDGILCWDLIDYLDQARRRRRWPTQLTRVLRPDGALLGFFGTGAAADDAALHEVHHRRRRQPAAPPLSGGARPADDPAQPRHHAHVPGAARVRSFLLQEQPARDPVPQAGLHDRLRPHRRTASARAVGPRVGRARGRAAHPRTRSRSTLRSRPHSPRMAELGLLGICVPAAVRRRRHGLRLRSAWPARSSSTSTRRCA